MVFSESQLDAARRGEAVRLRSDGIELVVLRADLYERVERLLNHGDDVRATYPAVLRAWDNDDHDDYDEYRNPV